MVHLLRVPFHFLAPAILLFGSVGAYAVRGLALDVMIMFIAGIAAFFLRRSGYSVAGIVLGLILGKIGEQNFAQAMQMVHYDAVTFFSRPIAALLTISGALTIAANVYKSLRDTPKAT